MSKTIRDAKCEMTNLNGSSLTWNGLKFQDRRVVVVHIHLGGEGEMHYLRKRLEDELLSVHYSKTYFQHGESHWQSVRWQFTQGKSMDKVK